MEFPSGVKGTTLQPTVEYLMFCLTSASTWVHSTTIYTVERKVVVVRIVVITCLLVCLICCYQYDAATAVWTTFAWRSASFVGRRLAWQTYNARSETRHASSHTSRVNPETDRSYSFKQYTRDIGIWYIMANLVPHKQSAAEISRLQGQAREIASTLTAAEVAAGVYRDGIYIERPNKPHGTFGSTLLALRR